MADEHTADVAEQAHPSGADPDLVRSRVEDALATSRPVFNEFFLARLLDLTITYDDDLQTTRVELPFADFLRNPQGSLHGGVIATAMDISMGHLLNRYLSTGVTIEMQLAVLPPGARSVALRRSSPASGAPHRAHLKSRLYDEQGRFAAYATGSWQRLDVPPDPRPAPAHAEPGMT